MKFFNGVLVASLVGVVLVAGPARGAPAAQQDTSAAAKVDDGELKSLIAANLKDSASLAPRDIDVSVEHGVVTLKGTVLTASEKARAGDLARVIGVTRVNNRIELDAKSDQSKIDAAGEKTKSGVTKAVDATTNVAEKAKEVVQKAVGKAEQGVGKAADKTSDAVGKAGDKVSDTSVTTRVKAAFSGETLLNNTAIEVDTTDRVVTLTGTVASNEARERAGVVAATTEGVTRVLNQLGVK